MGNPGRKGLQDKPQKFTTTARKIINQANVLITVSVMIRNFFSKKFLKTKHSKREFQFPMVGDKSNPRLEFRNFGFMISIKSNLEPLHLIYIYI